MQRIGILFLLINAQLAHAQVTATLWIDGEMKQERSFRDTLSLTRYVQNLKIDWINDGHIFSGLDSVSEQAGKLDIYLHKGDMHRLSRSNSRSKRPYKALAKELEKYINHGYPFATIAWDSLKLQDQRLDAILDINTGPLITYDSALFLSPLKTRHGYIYHLIDMVPETPFSERTYSKLARRVDRSGFLSLAASPDLSFQSGKAIPFLAIEEQAANTFEGVLGLQQQSQTQTTVVGSLDLNLQNLFRSGKELRFSWERFSEESQELNVFYKHPFFLNSKIAPSLRLDLLKQDSLFLTRSAGLGLHTFISASTELFAEYENTKGTLLTVSNVDNPEAGLADFSRNTYSLAVSSGLLRRMNQLKEGVRWSLAVKAGRKQIDRNLSLPDAFYDTIQLRTNFYQTEGFGEYQLRIKRRQALFHQVSFGLIENPEILFNERFRLGGLQSLRGFNEKSIFADQYLLSRFEFRSFFENESFVFVFYDQLLYRSDQFTDTPLGLGLGFSLGTSAGQFSFVLGVGGSSNQNISFEGLKAHFGYISRF